MLQPLIMGTAVKVHPLAVVLVVAAGTMLAGIPGALFAVPVAAVLNVMITYIASGRWRGDGTSPDIPPQSNLWQTVPQAPPRYRRFIVSRPRKTTSTETPTTESTTND